MHEYNEKVEQKNKRIEELMAYSDVSSELKLPFNHIADYPDDKYAEIIKRLEAKQKAFKQKQAKAKEQEKAALKKAEAKAKAAQQKLAAEQKEKKRIEKELYEKQLSERLAKEEAAAKLERELNQSDANKVKQMIEALEKVKEVSFKSAKNKKMKASVDTLIDKVITFINK